MNNGLAPNRLYYTGPVPIGTSNPLARQLLSQSAVSVIEFALVLPVLLILIFGGIEFGRATINYYNITSLSRQAAVGAMYICSTTLPDATHPNAMSNCIQSKVLDPIRLEADTLKAQIIIQAYQWSSATLSSPPPFHSKRVGIASYTPTGMTPPSSTQILPNAYFAPDNDTPAVPLTEHGQLLKNHEILVFAEVFTQYQPLFPFITEMFGFMISNGRLRVVTTV